jgi:hypothetical protein|tara:strand:+ start:262 stop:675 length:414 start_codon:yes stop_codon:yes gene_type:complete
MFSMFIDQNDISKIQLGGYDLKKYASGDKINWYPIVSKNFWALDFGNVKIGDYQFQPSVKTVMADTGTSLNMIPDQDFNQIYNTFFASKFNCRVLANTLTGCDCTASQQAAIPDINFDIGSDTYVIPRDQWFERSGN